jgi:catechol 2,3-dioxygenase-like lactoylglutathione lyase family enzyme
MKTKPKFICPLLVVADMQRARAFYENVLDQVVVVDYGENIAFEGSFSLHLHSHYQNLIDGKPISMKGNNFEIYFEFDDVDGLNKRLIEAGVEFVHPLREQPWRQKVLRFYDPDFHIVEIGESMEYTCFRLHLEGLEPEDISKTCMMPVPFILAAIEKYQL